MPDRAASHRSLVEWRVWRRLALVWTAAAWLWATAVVLMPTLVHQASSVPGSRAGLPALATAVYAVGALVCHQRPERSFHWHGVQAPVCARCTGIYIAVACGLILGWRMRPAQVPSGQAIRFALAACAMPVAATLVIEWLGWATPGNIVRAVSAAPGGVALGWLAIVALTSDSGRLLASAVAPAPRPLIH